LASDAFRLLLETDAPADVFEVALAGMRPDFDKVLLEWTRNLERSLLKLLPDGKISGDEEFPMQTLDKKPMPTPIPIPVFTILVQGQPIDNLPLDTQRLLRADTVFTRGYSTLYYPDNFTNMFNVHGDGALVYDTQKAKIAQVLLAALSHRNATYLQLKAAGSTFSCGRCESRKCVTWISLVCSPMIPSSLVKHH
jgi:hypothetical protein